MFLALELPTSLPVASPARRRPGWCIPAGPPIIAFTGGVACRAACRAPVVPFAARRSRTCRLSFLGSMCTIRTRRGFASRFPRRSGTDVALSRILRCKFQHPRQLVAHRNAPKGEWWLFHTVRVEPISVATLYVPPTTRFHGVACSFTNNGIPICTVLPEEAVFIEFVVVLILTTRLWAIVLLVMDLRYSQHEWAMGIIINIAQPESTRSSAREYSETPTLKSGMTGGTGPPAEAASLKLSRRQRCSTQECPQKNIMAYTTSVSPHGQTSFPVCTCCFLGKFVRSICLELYRFISCWYLVHSRKAVLIIHCPSHMNRWQWLTEVRCAWIILSIHTRRSDLAQLGAAWSLK